MNKRTKIVLASAAALTVAAAGAYSTGLNVFDGNVKAESNDANANKEVTSTDITLAKTEYKEADKKVKEADKNKALFTDFKAAVDAGTSILTSDFTTTNALIDVNKDEIKKAEEDNKAQEAVIKEQEKIAKAAEERAANISNVRDVAANKLNELESTKADINKDLAKANNAISAANKDAAEVEKQLAPLKDAYNTANTELTRAKKLLSAAEQSLTEAKDDEAKAEARASVRTFKIASNNAQADFDNKAEAVKAAESKLAEIKSQADAAKADAEKTTAELNRVNGLIATQSNAVEDNQNMIKEQVAKATDAYKAIGLAKSMIEVNNDKIEAKTQYIKDLTKGIEDLKEDYKTKTATPAEVKALLDAATEDAKKAAEEFKAKDQALADARQQKRTAELDAKVKELKALLELPKAAAKPAETEKPVDTAKPADTTKPADTAKPADTTKPADTAKPAETEKPADTAKPAETDKPAEKAKDEEVKPASEIKDAKTDEAKKDEAKKDEAKTDEAKKDEAKKDAAAVTDAKTDEFQKSEDGVLTDVRFFRTEDGVVNVEGSVNKDLLGGKTFKDAGFDKVVIKDAKGEIAGEFKVNEDYKFYGKLTKELKADDKVTAEYGGKSYELVFKVKDVVAKEDKKDDQAAKDQTAKDDQKAQDDKSENKDAEKTSKSQILPNTGQSSNLTSIVLGSIMTAAGAALTALKKFKKF